MLICQCGLAVLRPEDFEVPDTAFVGQCLKAGDVLEQSEHHVVELGAGESDAEFLNGNRHEATHFVVIEAVQ